MALFLHAMENTNRENINIQASQAFQWLKHHATYKATHPGLSLNESNRSRHCLIVRCPHMSGCPDMPKLPDMPTCPDMPTLPDMWCSLICQHPLICQHIRAHQNSTFYAWNSPAKITSCPCPPQHNWYNWYIHENAMRMVKNAKFLNIQQGGIHDVLIGRDILPFCIVCQTLIGLCAKSNTPG